MKQKWILSLLLLSCTAMAAPDSETVKQAMESAPSCANFVHYDQRNIYLGFGEYRQGYQEPRTPIPSTLTIAPISAKPASVTLHTNDSAIDSVTNGDSLFILTYSGIEEWSLDAQTRTAIYPTYDIGRTLEYLEHAQSFARYGNKMIIAHGRLGVSIFDLNKKRITNQFRLLQKQLPMESTAMGVAVQGKYAYVVMDNFSLVPKGKAAFRGIVVIDLESETVVRELDGMDPFVDGVVADANNLIVSFGGGEILWKYSLASLQSNTLPEPTLRIWKYTAPGHPIGHAVMDDVYYYTCFLKAPLTAGGAYKAAPAALNRKQLLLD